MAARPLSNKKPQHLGYTLRALLSYLGRHKYLLLLVAVLVVVSALANLLGTYMIRPVVNSLTSGRWSDLLRGVLLTAAIYLAGVLASLGYIEGGVAPIVGDRGFDPLYINPIPSGLVLTGIVVSVSITAFSLALIQRIYRRYGTIEMRELLDRAKKEDD